MTITTPPPPMITARTEGSRCERRGKCTHNYDFANSPRRGRGNLICGGGIGAGGLPSNTPPAANKYGEVIIPCKCKALAGVKSRGCGDGSEIGREKKYNGERRSAAGGSKLKKQH